jgi:hypothetical protein
LFAGAKVLLLVAEKRVAAYCQWRDPNASIGVIYWFVVAVKNCPQQHLNVSLFMPSVSEGRSRATMYIAFLQTGQGSVYFEQGTCCRGSRSRAIGRATST